MVRSLESSIFFDLIVHTSCPVHTDQRQQNHLSLESIPQQDFPDLYLKMEVVTALKGLRNKFQPNISWCQTGTRTLPGTGRLSVYHCNLEKKK
jgi:hypothetical protein